MEQAPAALFILGAFFMFVFCVFNLVKVGTHKSKRHPPQRTVEVQMTDPYGVKRYRTILIPKVSKAAAVIFPIHNQRQRRKRSRWINYKL